MAVVTRTLDKWWEVVLGESSEDDVVSVDTNSLSVQSYPSTSPVKQNKWLLPRQSGSLEDSVGEESDIFDFSGITARTSDGKATQTSTRKSKWGFHKKGSGKRSKKGRKQNKEQRDDRDQNNWWDLFDAKEAEEAQRKKVMDKEDDFSWRADFALFADNRDDNPSYDDSVHRPRDKYDQRFPRDEDEFTESSSLNGGHVDVWESPGLLGSPSDATVSSHGSFSIHTDDEDISSLLQRPHNGSKIPMQEGPPHDPELHSGIRKKQSSSPHNESHNTELDKSFGSINKKSPSFSSLVSVRNRGETTRASLRSAESSTITNEEAKLQDRQNNTASGSNGEDIRTRSPRCSFPFPLIKNTNVKKTSKHNDEGTSSSWKPRPKADKRDPIVSSQDRQQKLLAIENEDSSKTSCLLGFTLCHNKSGGGYDKYVDPSQLDGSIENTFSAGEGQSTGSSDKYAVVRMVPDSDGVACHTNSEGLLQLSHLELARGRFPEHLATNMIAEDSRLTKEGPVSMYVYDCDYNKHMGVVFDNFNEELRVRKYSSPPSAMPGEILVKVEASTVSYNDSTIRRGGWWRDETVPLPNTPGVDLIGVIQEVSNKVSSNCFINVGDRVMAFVKWGGNARYATVAGDRVVPIRLDVDPAEAVCLAETYLSAFQALHIGQSAGVRYGSEALRKKSILVLGARSSMGRAVIELAVNAGVAHIYATDKKKHHKALRSLGVIPLERNPKEWLYDLQGEVDLVLVADREEFDTSLFKVLGSHGDIVFIGKRVSAGYSAWLQEEKLGLLACTKDKANLMKRTHAYDTFESWERNTARCKHDTLHLLQLLAAKQVKPHIVDRIPLERVGRAQNVLDESKSFPGIFVCEPWVKAKRRALYL